LATQKLLLKARGLYTYPNNLSEVPEGALSVADNITVDRNGVVEPRRGFAKYGNTFGSGSDRSKQLLVYKNRIIRHYESTLQYDDGAGTFTSFSGDYDETETGLRLKSLEANGNLYFTESTGIKCISALTASEFSASSGYIRDAGGVQALDVSGLVDYSNEGFLTDKSKVAYRVTWAFKDANKNLVEGVPSSRTVITNYSDVDSGTVQLTFAIPSQITSADTDFFYRIYRTQVIQAATVGDLDDVDPGDEMNLVIEDFPSASDLVDRSITVEDLSPEAFREGGSLLYTNPVSGEGILQANYPPPLSKDVALFQGSVFYANTQRNQELNLSLLGVSAMTSGTSSVTITEGLNVNTYIFRGRPEITTFTFDTQANTTDGGYFLLNAASDVRGYFVWFDKTGATAEPVAADTVGRLAIRVDISGDVTDADVATSVNTELDTNIDFNSTALVAVVTATTSNNGNTTDAVNGITPVGGVFAINVTQQGLGEGNAETTTFTFDTKANTTDGSYFLLNSAQDVNEYFVWFDKTGTTPAPAGGDTTGRTGVRVDVSGGGIVTDAQMATAVEAAIAALPVFDTSVVGAVVTVTNVLFGPTTNATTGLVAPGGVFAISVTQAGNNFVLLSGSESVALAIDETARSLVNLINNNPVEVVNAFYLSGPDDVPGLILLQAREVTTGVFSLKANSTATGGQFNPELPTVGTTVASASETEPNALYYSKFQQPEAVPIVNKFNVGPRDKAIIRILSLRESLFVFKEDGIYRVTGQNASFTLNPFDNTAIITTPDSAAILNNQIYMLSEGGVATVSDTGVSIISRPIENILTRATSDSFDYEHTTFGVSYESDRSYLLWIVTTTSDDVATQCFRFNTFTNSWTRYPISKTCGVVNPADDKLYLGPGDENFIEQERKDFIRTDHADRQFALSLGANAIDGVTATLSSVDDVEAGDSITQVQYLTIAKFNQLLRMLDTDIGVTDSDYMELLEAEPGDDLRDQLDSLAIKLDADPGVNNGTFVASMNGGVSFAVIQSDFNIVTNLLNTASDAHYNNYPTSTGTITLETLIVDVIINSNDVTLKYETAFIEGPIITYRGISSVVVWAPQTFGDPSIYKQVSEGTFLFENTVFYSASAAYASDLSPNFETIDFDEAGLGDWGAFEWGEQNWGGEGSQVPLRTYIPRNKQRCRFLRPKFTHLNAREKFALFGLSLTFRPFSTRAYKG
jgi:hypothetical protein